MKESPGWGLFLKKSITDLGSKLASFSFEKEFSFLRRNWLLFLAEAGLAPGSSFLLSSFSFFLWCLGFFRALAFNRGWKNNFLPFFFVAAGSFI